jgi:acyl-phosphate glycerol 3-phosphate acyltransferase
VPVLLVQRSAIAYGLEDGTMAMVGLAAFLGHLYPVFFRFEGGKGVATFIGVVFGIHWVLGLATALTWLIIAFFFRYSSLASLVVGGVRAGVLPAGRSPAVVRGTAGGGGAVRDGAAARHGGIAPTSSG